MDVFAYGTLTDPDRAAAVLGTVDYRGPAVLDGLHRVDGEYPTLAPGGTVKGRILRTDDRAALDRYEGVERGLYVRVTVPVDDGNAGGRGHSDDAFDGTGTTVETYVGDPDRLGAPAEWPGDGEFAERVRSYLDSEAVVVRPEIGAQ